MRQPKVLLFNRQGKFLRKISQKGSGPGEFFRPFTRDDFRDDSDIDILNEHGQPMGIEFIDLAEEHEKLLKRPVDLVSRNGIKPKYFKEIQKNLMYV